MRDTMLQVFITILFAFELSAERKEQEMGDYAPVRISTSVLGEFSMLPKERDDYATNLARLALEIVHANPQTKNMGGVKKLLAMALNLSPRNREAVVANHQLSKGILPEKKTSDYSTQVFARLLLTRGKLLKSQEGLSDQLAGRALIEVAAELNPRNEDAVYEYEVQFLDKKSVDWSTFYRN